MIRYEYLDDSIQESDIHPNHLFEQEKKLAEQFVRGLHGDRASVFSPCPVNGMLREEVLFEKWGQTYVISPGHWSVGLGQMPDASTWHTYFYDSDLAAYRASNVYQKRVWQLRQKLWESLMEWVEGRCIRYGHHRALRVADWGTKFIGWRDTAMKSPFVQQLSVIDPLPPLQEEQQDARFEAVFLMDVLQRTLDPKSLLETIHQSMEDEGLLFITTRSGTGFDILTLREQSSSVFPLEHIFLPSPSGMKQLLESTGFEVLELSTPGLFDVDFVRSSETEIPRDQFFQRYMNSLEQEAIFERFQQFLQQNNLSSHMRVLARKKVG